MFDFDKITDRRGTDSTKWMPEIMYPMWIADMDFQTAPCITDYIKKRTEHGIFGYSEISDEWYEAYIGHWQRRHNFTFTGEDMIYSTGVISTLSAAVRKLTTPGEKVVVITPVYNIFFNCIRNNGRFPVEVPLKLVNNAYEIDFDLLGRHLADLQVSLLLFCNPQNPSGKLYTADEMAKIGELCAKYNVKVVSDEVHCDLCDPGAHYIPFASVNDTNRRISVTCLAPTKAYNIAGLPTSAAVVFDPVLRHKIWREINTSECGEPHAFACGITAAAFSEAGEQWLDELCAYIAENRRYTEGFFKEHLPKMKIMPSKATYLLWIDCREYGMSSGQLYLEIMRKTGVFLNSGEIYGQCGEGFLRMNIALPRPALEDYLDRLNAFE